MPAPAGRGAHYAVAMSLGSSGVALGSASAAFVAAIKYSAGSTLASFAD